jgi:lipopolysaccharide/colanic/teichoic acid biosynthesis glycosyltransferase
MAMERGDMHCYVLLCVDLLLILACTLSALVLCSADMPFPSLLAAGAYGGLTLAIAIPVLPLFRLNRTVWRFTSLDDSVRVAGATAMIVTLAASLSFSSGHAAGIPRLLPIMQGLLMFHALAGARIAMRIRHDLRRRARQSRENIAGARENVLIVGLNPLTDLFLHCAAENSRRGMYAVGILSKADRHRGRFLRSQKIIGPPEAIQDVIVDLSIHGVFVDRIVIALPWDELSNKARESIDDLKRSGKIRVDHLSPQYGMSERAIDNCDHDTVSHAERATLTSNSYLRWKRLIDGTVGLACAVCFTPLMVVVFVAVLVDVGWPVIFWQQRPGVGGRPIKVLKFRTMRSPRDRAGRRLTDVERVSQIGLLLRRFRLDELPQIYNVLFGHMSLVGPRPLLPADQPSAPAARLALRPGLTGWAQIKGGRHISSEDKAALDLWYIKNASFGLDLMILAHTVGMVLFGERVDRNAIREAWHAIRNDEATAPAMDSIGHNPI